MITSKEINSIINISESFQLIEKFMQILLSDKKDETFDRFIEIENDLSYDWFTDYFQEEHSNRKAMMQDFTPKEVANLLPRFSQGFTSVLDICAGTGGLSIGAWNKNPDAFFVCEELSERALPLLLFNMAIRNVDGYIVNKEVLSGQTKQVFRLQKAEKYSSITVENEEPQKTDFELVIENPPYSLKYKWDHIPDYMDGYGEPPTSRADYAFIVYGISRLSDKGSLCAILPHGVLFRGQKEQQIRKEILKRQRVKTIIGLPDKLFKNTDIPTAIIIIGRGDNNVLFIDASRDFLKESKHNVLRGEDIEKIIQAEVSRVDIDRYSRSVSLSEIEENGFNLNISQYVDTHIPEPLPDAGELLRDLMNIDDQIQRSENELAKMLKNLVTNNADDKVILKEFIKYLKKKDGAIYEQLTLDL